MRDSLSQRLEIRSRLGVSLRASRLMASAVSRMVRISRSVKRTSEREVLLIILGLFGGRGLLLVPGVLLDVDASGPEGDVHLRSAVA